MQSKSIVGTGFSRHRRRFLEWFGVLALVAYALQVTALDHWHADSLPQAEASSHSAHCHGNLSGCSDSSELPSTLTPVGLTSIPPVFILGTLSQQASSPLEAFLDAPDQPPQTA